MYKLVRWEIEKVIALNLPIIIINTNNSRKIDSDRMPPILREELSISISFEQKIIKYSVDNWIDEHTVLAKKGESSPKQWESEIYTKLGM